MMDEKDFSCGAGRKIATWDPWRLTIVMSILNANFGKNKQFAWAYPSRENSMNKDVGGQVHGVYGEPYVDGVVEAWGVCILTLTLLDFDANLGQMEMGPAMFLDLPGVLIFR